MDIAALVAFARDNEVDLVVPGPEAPLVAGLADALAASRASPAAGRRAAAARLEGSKSFTKEICRRRRHPDRAVGALRRRRGGARTSSAAAARRSWSRPTGWPPARAWWSRRPWPRREPAIDAIMERRACGEAGAAVVIEECLVGEEVSLLRAVRRHARGPARARRRTTSGSARATPGRTPAAWAPISPAPGVHRRRCEAAAMERIIRPTLAEMARRGTPFRGVLFAGLMLTAGRAEADRVQRPLRRPGVPGAAAAAALRPAAGAAGGVRRRAGRLRPALAAEGVDRGGDGGRAAIPDAPRAGTRDRRAGGGRGGAGRAGVPGRHRAARRAAGRRPAGGC